MIGGNVKLELLYPTVKEAAIEPVSAPVSDTAVEFTAEDLHPTGRPPVAAQHDITGSVYTFTVTEKRYGFFDFRSGGDAANTYKLTFDALGGSNSLSLLNADILRNDMGFKATDVVAGDNALSVNLSGKPYGPATELSVQLGFLVKGTAGNDTLEGMAGRDQLEGGDGKDTLIGGAGADVLIGGAGIDIASYRTAGSGVTVDLVKTTGNTGDAAGDSFTAIEGLEGSNFDDALTGSAGANTLNGLDGNDKLFGLAGNDSLYGGNGNDTIDGGAGNDRIIGDLGKDILTGGAGKDTFFFRSVADSTTSAAGRDTILDFNGKAGDKISLSLIDADTTHAGNQAFTFIGTKGFSGDAGELRYKKLGGDLYVYADVNGDKKADFSLHLDGVSDLQKGYFIL
ncbi:hypothetical protein BTR14_02690 [Rhizobium rhizosphaerae]|uniref:Uncharacterized protein n=1 Tax=Xaviernesmea rhizosphaerae TaxID=1672749 RepID=A0ABX3PIM3_9HYPH|nr:protease [Xaviernesmea rhizosphaerae]OQP88359.1 hypothetical protein BTR14_02690 [Xaviernesmea rhizosphaerae]